MVIKLSDTLRQDETELELHGDNELPMFGLGEMTKWKIWPEVTYNFTNE